MPKNNKLMVYLFCIFVSAVLSVADALAVPKLFDVMADLVVKDFHQFDRESAEMRAMGVRGVSTDLWWSDIEPRPGVFDWSYAEKVLSVIERNHLKWKPIIAFHQGGGYGEEDCDKPVPKWVWDIHPDLFFVDEKGKQNHEAVSPWGTIHVLPYMARVLREFQKHFAHKAHLISEINISLGPSGELRLPAFDYPHRGNLQLYSKLAVESFRNYARLKSANSIEALSRRWGFKLKNYDDVYPPHDLGEPDPKTGFFAKKDHFTPYGKDVFDWQQESLFASGSLILQEAIRTFNAPNSPFRGIDIGAKVPGVHWRMGSDRLAELTSGMLRTSGPAWDDSRFGHGYSHLIEFFKRMSLIKDAPRLVLHFTCLERNDGEEGPKVHSLAKSLVFWVGQEAKRQGVILSGENALAGALHHDRAWHNMDDALSWSSYIGITILRLHTLFDSTHIMDQFKALIKKYSSERNGVAAKFESCSKNLAS